LTACRALLKRRLTHEPIQYIIGETEFYSLPFKVTPETLIPRPETELLVDKVIEQCQQNYSDEDDIQILDVGTGSGCIAIAIAKSVENSGITAVDISHEALKIAYGNAQAHEVDIKFKEIDALKPWPTDYLNTFDIVVSNPPYVSFSEYKKLQPEIIDYEPKTSLLGGNDGLDFYRKFSNILPTLLKPNAFAFFEIGERQAASVKNIYADAGFSGLQIYDDLAGKNRVVKMHWNRSTD
jgi:release factor glutamine methyltransferase